MPARKNEPKRTPLYLLRDRVGLSRIKAAAELEVSVITLTRYELAQTDIPIGLVESMADLYGVPFETVRQAILDTKSAMGVSPKGAFKQRANSPYKEPVLTMEAGETVQTDNDGE